MTGRLIALAGRVRAWWSAAPAKEKLLAALGAVLLAALAVTVDYYLRGPLRSIGDDPKAYTIDLETNPDDIPVEGDWVGGSYFVPRPIGEVGEPPSEADTCVGRYDWATELGGFQAMTSTARVTIDALTDDIVHVENIDLEIESTSPPPAGTYLTCGGRGEVSEVRNVEINLDSEPTEIVTTDAGTNEPLIFNFEVDRDDSEVFHVSGTTFECDCTWRLRLSVRVGDDRDIVTIPATDEPPFRTISPVNARAYRWQNGEWSEQPQAFDPDDTDDAGSSVEGTTPTLPPLTECPVLGVEEVTEVVGGEWRLQSAGSGPKEELSQTQATETRCDFGTTEQSATLLRIVAGTPEDAHREFEARVGFYAPNGEPTVALDQFGDEALHFGGTIMVRRGSELLIVTLTPLQEPALTTLTERTITNTWN